MRIRVVTGSGQIALEAALVREILDLQSSDRLARIAVVVPSRSARLHLLQAIPALAGRAVLGVEVLHLAAFAGELLGSAPRPFEAPFVDAEAIRALLGEGGNRALEPFAGLRAFAGGPAALASTLRDLRDADLAPADLRAAADSAEIRALADLAEGLDRFHAGLEERAGALPTAAIARRAAARAPRSPYLRSLRAVLYFGAYDFVGVQRALLAAVSRAAETTLFFPRVRGSETFAFAEAALGRIARLSETEERALADEPSIRATSIEVLSAPGFEEEVEVAAKEILRLRGAGMPFEAIAVVSRDLPRRLPVVRETFEAHRIPFVCEFGASLGAHPFAKAAAAIASLSRSTFSRRDVLDLVGSPFFATSSAAGEGEAPDPALWERMTREAGIAGGETWQRLGLQREPAPAASREGVVEDGGERSRVPPEAWNREAPRLLARLDRLRRALGDVREVGTFREHADALEGCVDHLLVPPEGGEGAAAKESLAAMFEHLRLLEGGSVPWIRFEETFRRMLEGSRSAGPSLEGRGARVLDPAGARGRTFEALLLLGMNELVWPRRAREDPFLSDEARRRIGERTKRPLPIKGEAVEEDRLLFHLLLSSARRRALLVWSRTDDQGRPANPSYFLDAIARNPPGLADPRVPKPLEQRLAESPLWAPGLLSPSEAALASLWAGGDAPILVRRVAAADGRPGEFGDLFERGARFAAAIDDAESNAESEGDAGPLERAWERLARDGISPSALEDFARCPFRHFARRILRVEPLDDPETIVSLAPIDLGSVVHGVLRRFYEDAARRGESLATLREALGDRLRRAADAEFREWERREPVGLAVTWESWKRRIVELLEAVLPEDLDALGEAGLAPSRFEEEASATLPLEDFPLRVRGRLDRLDLGEGGRFRVVDYKFTTSRSRSAKDLSLLAVRGESTQAPLYQLLARAMLGEAARGEANFLVLGPDVDPRARWDKGVPPEFWESEAGTSFRDTLRTILGGLREGAFPITPGDGACRGCEYRSICRRDHSPSRRRGEASPVAKRIAALSEKALPGGAGKGRTEG